MKRFLMPATAVLVLVLFAPAIAFCQLSEGFESGIPPGWIFSGPALLDGTAGASSGISPTEGNSYGWISTGCASPPPFGQGTTCPTVATAGSPGYVALGLGTGTSGTRTLGIPQVQTSLATSPTFTLTGPGGIVSFDVNFITTDGTDAFADFALVQLVPSSNNAINLFVANTTCDTCAAVPPAVLNPGFATISPGTASFAGTTVTFGATTYGNVLKFGGGPGGPTGWMHVTYSAPADSSYTLKFLVTHVGDTNYPTALAIDNVQVQQTVTAKLTATTTPFDFNTFPATTRLTLDYTNSGTDPTTTNTVGQVTLLPISDLQFQNLVAGTFAQGSQCLKRDFGNGHFACGGTKVLCTNTGSQTPLGANCTPPGGTTGLIGITDKYSNNVFVLPTDVPNPGFLAANDNALDCAANFPPAGSAGDLACKQAYNIFAGIQNDCCTTSGTTKTFNSLQVPLFGLTTWYQPAGTTCNGAPGHVILQPVNTDGTSVFKQKSTVPVKFRVCDASGVSVGTSDVITSFLLTAVKTGTAVLMVDEAVVSTTPDTAFRWDPTGQQWIFNIDTKGQMVGKTYQYAIGLKDGTVINFQYGLR